MGRFKAKLICSVIDEPPGSLSQVGQTQRRVLAGLVLLVPGLRLPQFDGICFRIVETGELPGDGIQEPEQELTGFRR